MSWRRLVLSLGSITLLMAACARAAGTHTGGTGPSGLGSGREHGGTVTVGPQDAGKTITLKTGDTLVFSVSSAGSPAGAMRWRVLSYPGNLVSLISRSPTPPFRFRALDVGAGELRLTLGPTCGSPGPLAGSFVECPVAESTSAGGAQGIPVRVLTFPLKVVPPGR
jgi:hypothetical protein